MGLLTVDVTPLGVVMTSDSQLLILADGHYEIALDLQRHYRNTDKILTVELNGFRGLLGYVGTERLRPESWDGPGPDSPKHEHWTSVRQWLESYIAVHHDETLHHFAHGLSEALTEEWQRRQLASCLSLFIAGYEGAESRFWFAVNGDYDPRGVFVNVGYRFRAVNDLDDYVIGPRVAAGEDAEEIRRRETFHFRHGALQGVAGIFDAFNNLISQLTEDGFFGFNRITTLSQYAYVTRQRMEFVKRLFSADHGISNRQAPLIAGAVYVYSISPTGEWTTYPKIKSQARTWA